MIVALICLGLVHLLWVYFVAVMHLKHMKDDGKLTGGVKVMGYPALAVGLVLDLIVHLIIGTVIFIELPDRNEWTLSARLWRLSNDPRPSWRRTLALFLRRSILDPVDPSGIHKG